MILKEIQPKKQYFSKEVKADMLGKLKAMSCGLPIVNIFRKVFLEPQQNEIKRSTLCKMLSAYMINYPTLKKLREGVYFKAKNKTMRTRVYIPKGSKKGLYVLLDHVIAIGGSNTIIKALHFDSGKITVIRYGILKSHSLFEEKMNRRASRNPELFASGIPFRYFQNIRKNKLPMIGFVMDYFKKGCLFNVLIYSEIPLKKQIRIALQIAKGILFMHRNWKCVHLDIKSDNILVEDNNEGACLAKITDFGFTSPINKKVVRCGTCQFMAPEISDRPFEPCYMIAQTPIDIWAFGRLILEIKSPNQNFDWLNQFKPKEEKITDDRLFEKWKDEKIFKNSDHPFNVTIDNCLKLNPQDRWSALQIVHELEGLDQFYN